MMEWKIIEQSGISQREFAELIGVSRVTVSNWVRGAQKPTKVFARLAKRQLTYLKVAHRLKWLPGDIPKMHKTNVDSRAEYIHAKLTDAAAKIKATQAKAKKTT
jgi:transcriptional regulator with XRE-family HTH domain